MTSAMKSVEAAFTKGGGSGTFVPGHASAKEEAPTSEVSCLWSSDSPLPPPLSIIPRVARLATTITRNR